MQVEGPTGSTGSVTVAPETQEIVDAETVELVGYGAVSGADAPDVLQQYAGSDGTVPAGREDGAQPDRLDGPAGHRVDGESPSGYQLRVGSTVEFPADLTVVRWFGKDSEIISRMCQCYGVTGFVGPSIMVQLMDDVGLWTTEFIFAHELSHVLQVYDGRWMPEQRQAFEEEADGLAWLVISQMRAEGIHSMFGEDGKSATRKGLK